jgi:phage/plasmid-associated DNA primase
MMKKAFLVILNEADKSGTFHANNKMKALITEPTINIRPKGKTSYTMKSYHRWMSFSNNPDPNHKLKRRDLTFRMSDDKINNVAYFNEGNSYAKCLGVAKAIYDYFMAYDTKPHIVESDIPKGEYDEMLKETQKDSLVEFLDEMIYTGIGIKHVPINTLYENYLDFCKRNYILFNDKKQSFSTKLGMRKYNGLTSGAKRVGGVKQNVWTFDFNLLKPQFADKNIQDFLESDDEYGDI